MLLAICRFKSKLAERTVFNQPHNYLTLNDFYPTFQSAHRSYQSTETVLLKVQNDLLVNMEKGPVTIVVLPGLSAALDTIDHDILLSRLHAICLEGYQGFLLMVSYLANLTSRGECQRGRVLALCFLFYTLENCLNYRSFLT